MEVLPLAVLYDTLGLLGNRDSRGSGGAAHESVCNFVSGYPFRIHPGCCSSFRLRSGVPLYDLWRVCSRWLGHWSQRTERMPCHDTPASFLPEWPRMEASPTRLWAERQGLDRNLLVGIPTRPATRALLASPAALALIASGSMPARTSLQNPFATNHCCCPLYQLFIAVIAPPHPGPVH
jgi:hypothetical protein